GIFQRRKEAGEHTLRIATIFSYTDNEGGADADGLIESYELEVGSDGLRIAAVERLLKLVSTVDAVNDLPSEEKQLEFVKAFRELMRLRNVLGSFADFT